MKQFIDSKNRAWDLVVNVGTRKIVLDLTKIDLFEIFNVDSRKLFSDPALLVDVIYALCRTQAEAKNVTDIDFGEGMVGDALESASNALMEEVVDFFPSARRTILRAQMDKSKVLTAELSKEVLKKIDELDVQQLKSSMKSLESSSSTPDPSPSES